MKSIYFNLFLIILCFRNSGIAQGNPRIDSLERLLSQSDSRDTVRINRLLDLSKLYKESDLDKALVIAQQCLDLANDLGDDRKIAEAYHGVARIYLYQSKFDEALEKSLAAERIYQTKGTEFERLNAVYSTGIIYDCMGQNERAVGIYKHYIEEMRRIGNKKREIHGLGNLGAALDMLDRDSEAIVVYNQTLAYYEEKNDEDGILSTSFNVATLQVEQGSIEEAEFLSLKFLPTAKRLDYQILQGGFLNLLGKTQLSKARKTTGKIRQKHANSAIKYLNEAVLINEKLGDPKRLSDNLLNLSTVYEILDNNQLSLDFFKKYHDATDSLQANMQSERIQSIESKNEILKKEHEIQIQSIKARDQRILLWLLGLGFLGLVFWLSVIWRLRKKSETLLLNILPAAIAKRLKAGERPIADQFEVVSVVFVDIVDFTPMTSEITPEALVRWLNDFFIEIDHIAQKHGIEKIKTVGDCYMAVAGIPFPMSNHAQRIARFAKETLAMSAGKLLPNHQPLQLRIGLDCGAATAGVIGENKFIYDIWGDAVNTASRMERNGIANSIHCTSRFQAALLGESEFSFKLRGNMEIKGKGNMETCFLS
jgi:class 3 adenylate cyclase